MKLLSCDNYKHQEPLVQMMAKWFFFGKKRIKLSLGNFSTGQLPIFQPGEIML